jgi:phosphatidylserine/phosphatidylglycerophosphate/cardiolipin synthase-like enzyme
MTVMSSHKGLLTRLDQRVGDQLEAVLRGHHRRRLRRLGWSDAIEPDNGPGWWSTRAQIRQGNHLEVLIDGSTALPEFETAIRAATRSVHIAGWHASPDFRLSRGSGGAPLRDVLAEVAERVPVRLLLWAGPPLPVFQPTRSMVARAREEFMRDSAVQCALDKRERTMHCHHEKIIVIDETLAFVGGIDLTALQGDRDDSSEHPPREPLGWHDGAVRLRGPAVADVAAHFNQRWQDVTGESLPRPPAQPDAGACDVQVLRTVPDKTYGFAPHGEFTILDAYLRALRHAEHFIYLENQFLWSPEVADILVDKLQHPPRDDFRVLLLLPAKPSSGSDTTRGQLGRLLDADAGAGRLLATTISGHGGGESVQVYVHAKIAVIDDRWLTLGSANLNEHSLFNDTEMNVLTCDADLARDTRLRLWSEHTERPVDEIAGTPWRVIDEVWRPAAEEQARLDRDHLPRTHRLSLLASVSRRTDRLQGPMRGLLVDG